MPEINNLSPSPEKKKTLPAEEITERSTTKMGYFLLICMWVALFSLGQWSLSIIRDIPVPPKGVPYCIHEILALLDTQSVNPNYSQDLSCYPNGGRQFVYVDNNSNEVALTSDKPVFDLRETYNEFLPTAKKIQEIFRERAPTIARIYEIEKAL